MAMKVWLFTYIVMTGPAKIFTSAACFDQIPNCAHWSKVGECSRSPLYMLKNCPVSCNVCSGGVDCNNMFSDNYCTSNLQLCFSSMIVLNNCKKTCVCGCCPAPVGTTQVKSTTAGTTRGGTTNASSTRPTTAGTTNATTQPTTLTISSITTGETLATALATKHGTTSLAKSSTALLTTPWATTKIVAGTAQERVLSPVLLTVIIIGVLSVVGVLGLSLFCVWRKKRHRESSNKPGNFLPLAVPNMDSIPDPSESPLYYVPLSSPRNPEDLSVNYEQPPDGMRPDQDYEDPVYQESWNPSCVPSDNSKTDTSDERLDDSYSDVVGDEKLFLREKQNEIYEKPGAQNPVYSDLKKQHAGYQAPELSSVDNFAGRDIASSRYLPLNKATMTSDQPLKKTGETSRDPVYQESWNPSCVPSDNSKTDTSDERLDYSYSDVVGDEKLFLREKQNEIYEKPGAQNPVYSDLKKQHAGYQAPELSSVDNFAGRDIASSRYLPLNKATMTSDQPLKKTGETSRDPVYQESWNPSCVPSDNSKTDTSDERLDYSYSDVVGDEKLFLREKQNEIYEKPGAQNPVYSDLKKQHAGYQAPELSSVDNFAGRDIASSRYLPLNKATMTSDQPLKKTGETSRDPVYQESWNPSCVPSDNSKTDTSDERLDYSYSDVVGDEKLFLREKQNEIYEKPGAQNPVYSDLKKQHAGYQAPELSSVDNFAGRDIASSRYLPLNKATMTSDQPLKKTGETSRDH